MKFTSKLQYEIALLLRKHHGVYAAIRRLYARYLLVSGKILSCAIFITNRCNLKCSHCFIWEKTPKIDIEPDIVRKLVTDRLLKDAVFVITGGEFEMHPECDAILELIKDKKHIIASNGLNVKLIGEKVRKFKLRTLQLSLDGAKEAHDKIRGVNSSYDKVLEVIRDLRKITNIHISYTVTPWNTPEDLEHVKGVCRKYGLNMGINYLYDPPYYGVDFKRPRLYDASKYVKDFDYYTSRYHDWLDGRLSLPCNSIKLLTFVFPEGDVALCSCKTDVVLGNLHDNTFSSIWRSDKTKRIHEKFVKCNECWSSCNRAVDLQLHDGK